MFRFLQNPHGLSHWIDEELISLVLEIHLFSQDVLSGLQFFMNCELAVQHYLDIFRGRSPRSYPWNHGYLCLFLCDIDKSTDGIVAGRLTTRRPAGRSRSEECVFSASVSVIIPCASRNSVNSFKAVQQPSRIRNKPRDLYLNIKDTYVLGLASFRSVFSYGITDHVDEYCSWVCNSWPNLKTKKTHAKLLAGRRQLTYPIQWSPGLRFPREDEGSSNTGLGQCVSARATRFMRRIIIPRSLEGPCDTGQFSTRDSVIFYQRRRKQV